MSVYKNPSWWICLAFAIVNTLWGACPADIYIVGMLILSGIYTMNDRDL